MHALYVCYATTGYTMLSAGMHVCCMACVHSSLVDVRGYYSYLCILDAVTAYMDNK
jgi:hypothetical protein